MRQLDQSYAKRPLVDWTARQIHDPVWRLRYLRSVAPPAPAPTPATRWKSPKTLGLLTLLALGLVVAPLSLRVPGAANAASAAPPILPTLPTQPPIPRMEPAVFQSTPGWDQQAITQPPIPRMEPAVAPAADVWPVEKNSHFEIYSNGLRIENQFAVSHRPRTYVAFIND